MAMSTTHMQTIREVATADASVTTSYNAIEDTIMLEQLALIDNEPTDRTRHGAKLQ
jgi:hypothetical protein